MNKHFFSVFGVIVFLFSLYLGHYGVFFERYVVFLESLFSGSIVGTPLFNFFNIAYIWVDYLFYKLYSFFPGFWWLDASQILISILAFGLYMGAFVLLCLKRRQGFGLTLIFSLCATTLLYFNLISCNNSREVLILITLCLLLFLEWGKNKSWENTVLYILAGLFFWLILLLRYEFAALAALAFAGYLLFHLGRLKQQWKYFLLPGIIILYMSGYLYYDRNYTNNYAKETDFAQYLVSDADYVQSFEHFKSARDSMMYEAAKQHWFSDTANLRVDFFRSLQQYKVGFSAKYFRLYFPFYLDTAKQMFMYFVREDWLFVLFVVLSLLYVLMESVFVTRDIQKRWLEIIGPVFTTCGIIFLLCYLVKMETTVFQPMCMIMGIFILSSRTEVSEDKYHRLPALKIFFFIAFATLFVYANFTLNQYYIQCKRTLKINMAICQEADSLAKNKYLVLDVISTRIFDHRPGYNFIFKQPKNVLLYDNGQLILSEPYLGYHQKICQCNALDNSEYYKFLYLNKGGTIFLSTPERMAFVFSYLRFMHKLPYGYREIKGNFAVYKAQEFGTDLRYYELIDLPLNATNL